MIKWGWLFIAIGVILYIGAFFSIFSASNPLVYFISAWVLGTAGVILILIRVILDRIEDKQEEDKDDLSKY